VGVKWETYFGMLRQATPAPLGLWADRLSSTMWISLATGLVKQLTQKGDELGARVPLAVLPFTLPVFTSKPHITIAFHGDSTRSRRAVPPCRATTAAWGRADPELEWLSFSSYAEHRCMLWRKQVQSDDVAALASKSGSWLGHIPFQSVRCSAAPGPKSAAPWTCSEPNWSPVFGRTSGCCRLPVSAALAGSPAPARRAWPERGSAAAAMTAF